MLDNHTCFSEDIYSSCLQTVNRIRFSRREIDVVACLLKRRSTKKIASILHMSPKTVETHLRNIMLKLEVNSRDSIIDFFESSNCFENLTKHYESLLLVDAFKKCLREISGLKGKESLSCLIICWEEEDKTALLLARHVKTSLELAGIAVSLETQGSLVSLPRRIHDLQENIDQVICFLPKGFDAERMKCGSLENVLSAPLLFVLPEGGKKEDLPKALAHFDCIDLKDHPNKYFFSFDLLKRLLPNAKLEEITSGFKSHYEATQRSNNVPHNLETVSVRAEGERKNNFDSRGKPFLKTKTGGFLSLCFMLSLLGVALFTYSKMGTNEPNHNEVYSQNNAFIQSDLIVPVDSVLLDRSDLLNQMDKALNKRGRILVIALVGLGGAGKTTLARQYALRQKAGVTWEINAETQASLQASFDDLAQALAKTDEDYKRLKGIQEIKDVKTRETERIHFVQKKLSSDPSWFLIFDNVEAFADIQKYLPRNSSTWGNGKVIITTRNSCVQSNNNIDYTVQVEELTPEEKSALFMKVISSESTHPVPSTRAQEIRQFLKSIPSFPLDVSTAAYYLKTTNTSCANYLESLSEYNRNFTNIQAKLLKESGDYAKTRYDIVTLSLEQIIKEHEEFKDLLLFISFLNPQQIPLDLLNSFKDNVTVSRLIYNLKRHSFIVEDASQAHKAFSTNISFHRSVHQILNDYIKNKLNVQKNDKQIDAMVSFLHDYMADLIINDDIARMKQLAVHVQSFLLQEPLLSESQRADLMGKLGFFYIYFADYYKARETLEKSLSLAQKQYSEKNLKKAEIQKNLGFCYKLCGQYDHAKECLEKSYAAYNENPDKNGLELAEICLYLGNLYTSLGEYKEARDLLEKGLLFSEKFFGKGHMAAASSRVHLGILYKRMGLYKEAVEVFEKALSIYKNQAKDTDIYQAWTMILLGSSYGNMGFYEKALNACQAGVNGYKIYYNDENVELGRSFILLGNIYRRLGDYEKALYFIKKGNKIYIAHFGTTHLETAWADLHLGNIYRLKGDFKKAKPLIENALHVYTQNFGNDHVDTGWALIYLGQLYKDIGDYDKAWYFLNSGLKIYSQYYGDMHTDLAWIYKAFGEIYLKKKKVAEAEKLLNHALFINQETQNPESLFVLESLATLCFKKSEQALKNNDVKKARLFKTQARDYLKQALKVAETYFPKESPHILELTEKFHL